MQNGLRKFLSWTLTGAVFAFAAPLCAAPAPVRSDVRLSNGKHLSFLHWANPGKPAILLLHGKSGYASSFTDFAERLGDRYDLYAVDMRGRGYSDKADDGDYTVETTLTDLSDFTRAEGLTRFGVYGHSFGAVMALAYAAQAGDQVTWVILEDGGPINLPDGSPAPLNAAQKAPAGAATPAPAPLRFDTWAAATDWQKRTCRYYCTPMQLESAFIRTTDGVVERSDTLGLWASKRGAGFDDQWPFVRALTMPTLVLRAESGLLPEPITQAMVALNPHVRYVNIAGAEHSVRASQPDAAYREIEAFLKAQDQ